MSSTTPQFDQNITWEMLSNDPRFKAMPEEHQKHYRREFAKFVGAKAGPEARAQFIQNKIIGKPAPKPRSAMKDLAIGAVRGFVDQNPVMKPTFSALNFVDDHLLGGEHMPYGARLLPAHEDGIPNSPAEALGELGGNLLQPSNWIGPSGGYLAAKAAPVATAGALRVASTIGKGAKVAPAHRAAEAARTFAQGKKDFGLRTFQPGRNPGSKLGTAAGAIGTGAGLNAAIAGTQATALTAQDMMADGTFDPAQLALAGGQAAALGGAVGGLAGAGAVASNLLPAGHLLNRPLFANAPAPAQAGPVAPEAPTQQPSLLQLPPTPAEAASLAEMRRVGMTPEQIMAEQRGKLVAQRPPSNPPAMRNNPIDLGGVPPEPLMLPETSPITVPPGGFRAPGPDGMTAQVGQRPPSQPVQQPPQIAGLLPETTPITVPPGGFRRRPDAMTEQVGRQPGSFTPTHRIDGEPVQVIGQAEGGLEYVRADGLMGWATADKLQPTGQRPSLVPQAQQQNPSRPSWGGDPEGAAMFRADDVTAQEADTAAKRPQPGAFSQVKPFVSPPKPKPKTAEKTIPQVGEPIVRRDRRRPQDVEVDAQTYQFKESSDPKGVTGVLAGTRKWDDKAAEANPITIHVRDRTGGSKEFVVNGHQRTGLARELAAQGQEIGDMPALVLRESDGWTAEMATAFGARQNIQQNSGTAVDVARLIRDKKLGEGVIETLPPGNPALRDGRGLAQLSDEAFAYVTNRKVAAEHGAFVGQMIDDPAQQAAAMQLLAKRKPGSREEARHTVTFIRQMGFDAKADQGNLFGAIDLDPLVEYAGPVLARVARDIDSDKGVFNRLLRKEETVASVKGNRINKEGTKASAVEARDLENMLDHFAHRAGPVQDALRAEAAALKAKTTTVDEAATRVREAMEAEYQAKKSQGFTLQDMLTGAEKPTSPQSPGSKGSVVGAALKMKKDGIGAVDAYNRLKKSHKISADARKFLDAYDGHPNALMRLLKDESGEFRPDVVLQSIGRGVDAAKGAVEDAVVRGAVGSYRIETMPRSEGPTQASPLKMTPEAALPKKIEKLEAQIQKLTDARRQFMQTGNAEGTRKVNRRIAALRSEIKELRANAEATKAKAEAAAREVVENPQTERSGEKYAGNVNLDRVSGPEDLVALREQLVNSYEGQYRHAKRGTKAWETTEKEAGEKGMTPEMLLGRDAGETYDAANLKAAMNLVEASWEKVSQANQKIRQGGNSDENLLELQRAIQLHVALDAQFRGAASEAGRALNIMKKMAQVNERNRADIEGMLDAVGGRDHLGHLSSLLSTLETPGQAHALMRQAGARNFASKLQFYYINALLSGVPTQLRNIFGNGLNIASKIGETYTAAMLRPLTGGPVTGGEAKAMTVALTRGFREGLEYAWHVLRYDESQFNPLGSQLDQAGNPIEGAAGAVIGAPVRVLRSFDDLFKGIFYRMEINGLAYREAAARARSNGVDLEAEFQHLVDNPTREMMQKAEDAAAYHTFNNKPDEDGLVGMFANKLLQAKSFVNKPDLYATEATTIRQKVARPARAFAKGSAGVVLSFLSPFVRVPANIADQTIERSVLAPATRRFWRELGEGGEAGQMAAARALFGSLALAGFIGTLKASNVEITGAGPKDWDEKNLKRASGWQPYSIRLGDKYYSYTGIGTPSMLLGMVADLMETDLKDVPGAAEKLVGLGTGAVASFGSNILNQTYMRGMREMMDAFLGGDPQRDLPRWVNRQAAGFVPFSSFMGRWAMGVDDTLRAPGTLFESIATKIPWASQMVPARTDVLGQPIKRDLKGLLAATSPIYTSTDKKDPVVQVFLGADAQIGEVRKQMSLEGTTVDLTPDLHASYKEWRGKAIRLLVESQVLPFKDDWEATSQEDRQDYLTILKRQAADLAREEFTRENFEELDELYRKAYMGGAQ